MYIIYLYIIYYIFMKININLNKSVNLHTLINEQKILTVRINRRRIIWLSVSSLQYSRRKRSGYKSRKKEKRRKIVMI